MKTTFLALLACLLACESHAADPPGSSVVYRGPRLAPASLDSPDLRAAAERELKLAQALVTQETYEELGFKSATNQLSLGQPIALYVLRVADLEAGLRGALTNITLSKEVLFPVEVEQQARAALILQKNSNGWETVSFGMGTFMQRIAELRQTNSLANGWPLSAYSVVQVPALELSFLACEDVDRLQFVPLQSLAELKIQIGQMHAASDLLPKLLPLARQILGKIQSIGSTPPP